MRSYGAGLARLGYARVNTRVPYPATTRRRLLDYRGFQKPVKVSERGSTTRSTVVAEA
jgi:hypothetical protein